MNRAVRVAIAGAGLMGRWHAHAATHAGARVTAIVDPDRSLAEHLAARYRGCRAYGELGESFDVADVVHICTPTPTHAALTAQALSARRHVLVEKPLAPTASDTQALHGLAAAHAVLLCPVHQFLFQDGVRMALALPPAIGPLRHVDITMCSAGAEHFEQATRERIALEILPHPLSMLARLLPGTLPGIDWSVRRPAAGEIRAIGQAGDVTVALLVSMSGRPTVNRMQLIGARGTMHVDLFHGFAATQAGTVSRVRKVTQPFTYAGGLMTAAAANLVRRSWRREAAYAGLRRLVELFYRAAINGAPCPIAATETLAVAQAYDRLHATLTSL